MLAKKTGNDTVSNLFVPNVLLSKNLARKNRAGPNFKPTEIVVFFGSPPPPLKPLITLNFVLFFFCLALLGELHSPYGHKVNSRHFDFYFT
ncbi:hypothetical protein GBA52_028097 [Prunus armeniaca]|nr:hypothetical protein GBA52_028097 [Prunus armeniaca]